MTLCTYYFCFEFISVIVSALFQNNLSANKTPPSSTKKKPVKSVTAYKSRERKHRCKYCERAFTTICDIKRHENSHFGIKPFICPVCGKGFARKYHLSRHVTSIHQMVFGSLISSSSEFVEPTSFLHQAEALLPGDLSLLENDSMSAGIFNDSDIMAADNTVSRNILKQEHSPSYNIENSGGLEFTNQIHNSEKDYEMVLVKQEVNSTISNSDDNNVARPEVWPTGEVT